VNLLRRYSEKAEAVSSERKRKLHEFEKSAELKFRNLAILNKAFMHRSFPRENGVSGGNNERLEFLGDSVLGLVIAEYLFNAYPGKVEGELARIKSFIVSKKSLVYVAHKLRIATYLLVGKGEEVSGGREKPALLENALEAIIGAYFLDSGFKSAQKFVLKCFLPEIDKVVSDKHSKDYKTLLQEYVQKRHKICPKYSLSRKSGPDHDKTFWVEVEILDTVYATAKGKTKKKAERNAAAIAYREINPPL
jgi:ribonuclease-3